MIFNFSNQNFDFFFFILFFFLFFLFIKITSRRVLTPLKPDFTVLATAAATPPTSFVSIVGLEDSVNRCF